MKAPSPQTLCRTGLLLLLGTIRRSAEASTDLARWCEEQVSAQVDQVAARQERQQQQLQERLYRLSQRLDGVMDAIESRVTLRRHD